MSPGPDNTDSADTWPVSARSRANTGSSSGAPGADRHQRGNPEPRARPEHDLDAGSMASAAERARVAGAQVWQRPCQGLEIVDRVHRREPKTGAEVGQAELPRPVGQRDFI